MYDDCELRWRDLGSALLRLLRCRFERSPYNDETKPKALKTTFMSPELDQVRRCAFEYAYQHAWMVQEKRENPTLAVARVWLEIALALYRARVQVKR